MDSIDETIDPCDDFYYYTCSNWIKNHPVPPTESHWNQFEILGQQLDNQIRDLLEKNDEENDPHIVKVAKDVYSACMDVGMIFPPNQTKRPLITYNSLNLYSCIIIQKE